MNDADATVLERTMMGLHDQLDRDMHAHQVALLDRDFVRALQCLQSYRATIGDHMADEEGVVLPLYDSLGGDRTDAPVRLFLGEHSKMRDFLADFATRVAALERSPDDHALLELLDRQATYKNLMLHHDLRERRGLYPFLSERVPVARQHELVAALRVRIG